MYFDFEGLTCDVNALTGCSLHMRDPVLTSCTAKITQLTMLMVVVVVVVVATPLSVPCAKLLSACCPPRSIGRQLPEAQRASSNELLALHHHVASLSPHARKLA